MLLCTSEEYIKRILFSKSNERAAQRYFEF